jgi:hypothetical protein
VKTELMPEVDFSQFDHNREEREEEAIKTSALDTELKWD